MDKLASLWSFVRKHKYLITLALFAVIIGFLDENSVVRRLGYAREESRLRDEIEKYRKEYEENTERLNELAVDSGAIERIAREKYLMKKPNEDIYVFEEDIEELIPALFAVGAVMLLAGAAVYITGWPLSPYIYTIGATMVALAQINSPSKCKSPTVKRLRRQQIFGALLLVLTGAFMLFTRGNEWIVSLTIAAILELYTSIRIPQEEAKEGLS